MSIRRAFNAAPLATPALVVPDEPEVPCLIEKEPALDVARRVESKIALDIQALRVEGMQAEIALGRINDRFAAGGTPQQADVDEKAAAEAVIASIEPRIAILQNALHRAQQKTKAAASDALKAKKEELKRRALHIRAQAKADAELWPKLKARASDLDVLQSRVQRAGDYTTTTEAEADTLLAETAEFARPARADIG